MQRIKISVNDEGKLKFTDSTGADTVLNFSSGLELCKFAFANSDLSASQITFGFSEDISSYKIWAIIRLDNASYDIITKYKNGQMTEPEKPYVSISREQTKILLNYNRTPSATRTFVCLLGK